MICAATKNSTMASQTQNLPAKPSEAEQALIDEGSEGAVTISIRKPSNYLVLAEARYA